jgi:hypothetical protein
MSELEYATQTALLWQQKYNELYEEFQRYQWLEEQMNRVKKKRKKEHDRFLGDHRLYLSAVLFNRLKYESFCHGFCLPEKVLV